MAKNDNLTDFLTDVANAIREKKGTTELINPQNFSDEIASIETGGGGATKWTGHADAEGLRAIGWTDEDIAYYQENGVNWNEEDDQYHLVSEDNKALYGVVTIDNISNYKCRIVYLPKIDASAKSSLSDKFNGFNALIAIPMLVTRNVTDMSRMFSGCYSLVSVPQLDTSNVKYMSEMFSSCYSLVSVPQFNTSNVTNVSSMFKNCYSLVGIPQLDTSNATNMSNMFHYCRSLVGIPQLDTGKVTSVSSMFANCCSLVSIPMLDTGKVTSFSSMFSECYSLRDANIKSVGQSYQLNSSALLSKESLLYIINNEAATSAITIKLASYAYERLANDADILEALTNHPNITLAK